mmetsp:Transcript_48274/g.121538  ORF Transcript_48274/g.121538 Transcript_48274/m.121538 type:complete len:214 (-) Transcript_48274:206-847(-)|eukprot:CAMPEP_0177640130 /NCGR_PEP_ID=MMETSP0447-20121125/6382_1 /TAXON_ID=0 /ORGANISM="Stygamoeba regulata, Strain BSH-02190019" /LENGTH=213 /DNA_ID=CAMNT_0019142187 /DNA_START=47 /DNA_END=688 /DNA_ORIENTATION=+
MPFWKKKKDPVALAKEWQTRLRQEQRGIDREIRGIEREENRVKMEIKAAAKRGDKDSARLLAREMVRSRKAKQRLYMSKAQMQGVITTLQSNIATMRTAGCMKQSAEVMEKMNKLCTAPQLQRSMMVMAREMEKAGLIEEMIEDTFEDLDEDLSDEADEEVQKVLDEMFLGVTDAMSSVPSEPVPEAAKAEEPEAAPSQEETELMARLNALSA